MSDTTTQLQKQFEVFIAEDAKFNAGNLSAGTRARKALSEIAKLAKDRRGEIQDAKNAEAEAKAS